MDRLSLPQRIPWMLRWTRRFAAEVQARSWECFLGGQIRIGAVADQPQSVVAAAQQNHHKQTQHAEYQP